jgi:hypothetical protein
MPVKNNNLTVSGAVVFRDHGGKRKWLVVKTPHEDRWEIPKITVRRGESSVRASLRMTAEMAGMNTRILEEAGRSNGIMVVGDRSMPIKYYYYLMIQRSGGEMIGFEAFQWLEYAKASKKIFLKREKDMLRGARETLKELEKNKKKIR